MRAFVKAVILWCMLSLLTVAYAHADVLQVIAGDGPSTTAVQLFVEKLGVLPQAKGYTFKVPPKSAKHAGGIRGSDKFIS